MKKYLSIAMLAGMAGFVGCSHSSTEPAAAPSAEKSAEPESRVKHGTNGEVIITLDVATQKLMGLEVAPLVGAQLSPEVTGFGRVVDPATLATIIADFVSAQSAAEASQKDFARLKTLAQQNNASARALETAAAAAQRDAAQAAAARIRLLAATGKALGERDDLSTFVQSLTSGERALVRIDLPAGEILKGDPIGARLVTLAEDAQPIEAKFLGTAAAVDPQMQGRGFLFLVESNQSRLLPGAAITGFIKLSGDGMSGVIVPRNAVIRFNGATWIYLQTGEETFPRKEVVLDRPLNEGWFIRGSLKDGKVVTVGAQQMLSEELKGEGGGE